MPFILLFAVLLVLIPVLMYNNLVRKKNATDNAFYSMDVQLKKRHDLIPQLIDTVKGYMQHERTLLESLTQLRQQAMTNSPVNDRVKLDNALQSLIRQLSITVEKYPELKASTQFLRLQGAINETEEQLAASRRYYNAAVNDYHNAIQSFPSSLIAGWAGMRQRDYFSIDEKAGQTPVITMN